MSRIGFAAIAVAAVFAAAVAAPTISSAQSVEEFYKGKRVKFLIGFGTGGGYNLYSRHLARHIGKHIPHNPNVIAQNMPGAGSIRLTNYLAAQAPRDGTEIGMISQAIPMSQLLGYEGVKFDVREFKWIGNASVSNGVTSAWHTQPFKKIQDVMKNEMIVPATGGRSTSTLVPRVMNAILGTKFKIIQGFAGGGQMNLAIERGEVQGRGSNTLASWAATKPDWVEEKKLVHLVQMGLKRDSRIADVPLVHELGKTKEDRKVLSLISALPTIGRPVAAPPGTPSDRVTALRAAFDATMKDAEYLAEAKKLKMEIVPMSGADLETVVADVMATPKPLIEKFKQAIKYGRTYQCVTEMKDASRCRKAKKKKKKDS